MSCRPNRPGSPLALGKAVSLTAILAFAAGGLAGCNVYKGALLAAQPGSTAGAGSMPSGVETTPDAGASDAGKAASFDPGTCSWGECWWSTPGDESGACKSAGMPRPSDRPSPDGQDSISVPEAYFGFTHLHLGSTNRVGEATDDAWQEFGFDLDGICTNSSTCPGSAGISCRNSAPAVPFDGQLCRDNTFARLQPVVAAVPELGERFGLSEDAFNCALWRGNTNTIIRLSGYNGKPDDSQVRVDFYNSNGLEEPRAWQCPSANFQSEYPRWRASQKWRVDQSTLTGPVVREGTLPDSKIADANAYVKHGYLVAQFPDGARQGLIGDDLPYHGFLYTAHQGLLVGSVVKAQDGTWEMRDGLMAGRIRKADMAQAFREIGFCEAGEFKTFYTDMLGYLEDNADVLASGENNPNLDCDAMSYAIGFEAAQLTPGAVATIPPRIECCLPGKTREQCNAQCGDGKLSGDEKCDTAIAAGQPGACPTACAQTSATCAPLVLTGSACTAECTPMPITMAGAKDGCCPAEANAITDVDCTPKCGNDVIEAKETCDPPGSCAPCATTDPCLATKPTGAANTCDLRCELVPVTQCTSGDKCCPSGCSRRGGDQDCSGNCGNGKIDSGETCDGTAQACPATCDDNVPCTTDIMVGSASNCNVSCNHTAITQTKGGDGCCPDGATANTDDDCTAKCGNKVLETGEQCDDGNQQAGDGCVDCKTETPGQICLVKLNSTDACAQCSCNKCSAEVLGCQGVTSASEAMLCDDMVRCGKTTGCRNPDCLCGTADLLTCLAGGGNGPCQPQVIAAARTASPVTIQLRASDTNYPIGRANALGDCVNMNCPTECQP